MTTTFMTNENTRIDWAGLGTGRDGIGTGGYSTSVCSLHTTTLRIASPFSPEKTDITNSSGSLDWRDLYIYRWIACEVEFICTAALLY